VGIVTIYTIVIVSLFFLNQKSYRLVTDEIRQLKLANTESLFKSKAIQVGNIFQSFLNDLDLNKVMIQDFTTDRLVQSPPEPVQRDYYLQWFEVLNNYSKYSNILETSAYAPDEYISPLYS
jgi:preprotein translocase subunit SecY